MAGPWQEQAWLTLSLTKVIWWQKALGSRCQLPNHLHSPLTFETIALYHMPSFFGMNVMKAVSGLVVSLMLGGFDLHCVCGFSTPWLIPCRTKQSLRIWSDNLALSLRIWKYRPSIKETYDGNVPSCRLLLHRKRYAYDNTLSRYREAAQMWLDC